MARRVETKNYYTVTTDQRDLNYSQYFHKGEINISNQNDYTSHNAKLLNVSEIKKLLLKLDFIKETLNA